MSQNKLIEKIMKEIPLHCSRRYFEKTLEKHLQALDTKESEIDNHSVKLLGTDTEDGITCEIRGYWKDGICYVQDVINKRA